MKPRPPNSEMNYNPEPVNIRILVDAIIEQKECSQNHVCTLIGVAPRTMRAWLAGTRTIPYTAQYALEALLWKY